MTYTEDNLGWVIALRSSKTEDDPDFLFNYGVSKKTDDYITPLNFKHVLVADKNKFFWSAGDSTNVIHVVLCIDHKPLNLQDEKISWNNFQTKNARHEIVYTTYHARSLFRARRSTHEEADSPDETYLNFIEHSAGIHVEFQPADPMIRRMNQIPYTCDVKVHDYLNYFYHHFPESEAVVYVRFPGVKPDMDFRKFKLPKNYLGYWIIWHRSRLEDMGSDDSWNPPTTVTGADTKWMDTVTERWIAADTVLCGMPGEGGDVDVTGNMNCGKGAGLTWKNSNYPRRNPFSIPLFFGPGILSITDSALNAAVNIYSENKSDNRPLSLISSVGGGVDKNIVRAYDGTIKIDVKSILKKEVTDWSMQGGLIREHPYDDQEKFYEGQTPGGTPVKYDIERIEINTEWMKTAESRTTKCAIVFVMIDSATTMINGEHFPAYYTQHNNLKGFAPTLIQVSDSAKVSTGDDKSAFTFDSKYPYIIEPNRSAIYDTREITVNMPPANHYYQMGALIYRIVDDNGGYKVDPDYNFPFEYWIGIRTGTSKKQYRIAPESLKTQTPKGSSSTPNGTGKTDVTTPENVNPDSHFPATPVTIVRVSNDVPTTFSPPSKGSYIRCYMLDVDTGKKTWSDTRILLPPAVGETIQRDIIFLLGDIHDGGKFHLYIQQYDSAHRPVGSPKRIGPEHDGNRTYDIQSMKMVVDESATDLKITLSDLKMPNVPSDAKFTYTLDGWIDDHHEVTESIPESKPSELNTTLTWSGYSLPKSAICDFIFTVYEDTKQVAFYHYLYLTEHFIKSFTVTDIYRGANKYSEDGWKARVQFTFEAHTTLPDGDNRYKCRIELHKFTYDVEEPPTIAVWDFEEIHGDFKATADSPIDIDRSQYVIFIQLIENGTNIGREKFYVFWEAPGRMASGQIISDGGAVTLSSPATRPNEVGIEYRIMRDGLLGVVESPWEMRTESMIGGNAVTQPAWIVRPRIVSFRLLVTAPVDLMPEALHTLFDVLTAAPKKGMTIELQSSNEFCLLSLNGYIQVGSPKIEEREDRWAKVSVVLECPNYAWQGRRLIHQANSDGEKVTSIRPQGHYPPDVSIWIKWENTDGVNVQVNKNEYTLNIKAVTAGTQYVCIRHNPITQEYSVTGAATLPLQGTTSGRSTILRSHSPHSICSMLLGDDKNRMIEEEDILKLIAPGSYLPIILDPWITNTITVTGGKIVALVYTPYYAYWW